MKKQLRQKLGDGEAHELISRAVYLISIGTNDYYSPFTANSSLFQSHSHEEYVGMVVGNITNVIKVTYILSFVSTDNERLFNWMD